MAVELIGASPFYSIVKENNRRDWFTDVDKLLIQRIGLSRDDLEDWPWNDDFERGTSPSEAVREFMETEYPYLCD